MMKKVALTSVLALGVSLAAADQACAQSANTAQGAATQPAAGVADIVVTAQRIKGTAQKTPISIQVLDQTQLQAVGSVADLQKVAPSLTFTNVQGEAHLTLRGITSNDVTETGDPAVIVSYDGFTVSRPYTMTQGMYDLDRVEILKGPQGTLFGRNAVGGVVNVVSHAPTDKFEGDVAFEYGNYNTINTEGMLNIPVSDKVQLRAAFQTRRHEGYSETYLLSNPSVTQRVNDEDQQSGRIELAFQPAEGFEGQINFQVTHQGGNGPGNDFIPWTYDAQGFLSHAQQNYGNGREYGVATFGALDSTSRRVTGRLSYDELPGGMTLTYLGGYDYTNWHQLGNNTAGGATPDQYDQNEFPKTLNQELRLTSDQAKPLTFQTGVYLFQERSSLNSQQLVDGGATQVVWFNYPRVMAVSKAIYGQVNYAVTDQLKLSGGLRYTHDDKSRTGDFQVTIADPANPPQINENGVYSSSRLTYHAGIQFSPTSRNMLYATTDSGYKAGGFNSGVTGATNGEVSFQPETVTAYEIGSKNRFFDNKLQLNLSGFYYRYHNLQTLEYPAGGVASTGSITVNAEGAHVYGADLEAVYAPTHDDKLTLNGSWLHARYTNFLAAPTEPLNPAIYGNCGTNLSAQNCQLAGNALPESPNIIFTFGGEHTIRNVAHGDLILQADVNYKGRFWFDAFNLPDTEQKGYALFDATITYKNADHHFSITGYMRNIGNKTYLTDGTEFSSGGVDSYLYLLSFTGK